VRVELAYGSRPYPLELDGRDAEVLGARPLPLPPPVAHLLRGALDAPVGAAFGAARGARVTLIVSDATRDEPRAAFVTVLRERIPHARWTLAIATGTHGPARIGDLGLPDDVLRDATIVNHDGHAARDLVDLGTTQRGTPVRVHRCLVETDLVLATGCIRPHYFAGFGAGAKALFPGLAEATAIRTNHRWKTDPHARAGIVDGNPCRDDLEEAVRMIQTPTFLLNAVVGPDERVHAAVAGDVFAAFRVGADIARPWFTVSARPAPLVIASDALPVSASLYQAAKIAAAAAPLVAPGGALVVAAECADGIGPLDTVNEAIFRIGVLPRLPERARLVLVSALSEDETRRTLLAYAASVDSVLASVAGRVLVLPRASHLLAEPCS
jgi:nickel-dependent lactate racemase